MAIFNINGFTTTAQTLNGNENGLITNNGTLNAYSGVAVTVNNSASQTASLSVLGTLVSNGNDTAKAVDFNGADFNMFIGSNAQVLTPGSNTTAIDLTATGIVTLANSGSIFATENAIRSGSGDVYSEFELINNGDITGGRSGVYFSGQTGQVYIFNTGSIVGADYGIGNVLFSSNSHFTSLQNSGIIQGFFASYQGSVGPDDIDNSGQMIGGMSLRDGNDTYLGSAGVVIGIVRGGNGNDRLIGGENNDDFRGDADDDVLAGNGGDDRLDGGSGNDVLRGGRGNDTLIGGTGDDLLRGRKDDDVLNGGDGDDELRGGSGDDVLNGGDGDDELRGGTGDDVLNGDGGRDDIRGGTGDDILIGGAGVDKLNGGRDDDILTGNGGRDDFIFFRKAGDDRITDFKNNIDQIVLTAFGFNSTDFASEIAPALSDAGGGDTFLDLGAIGGQGSILIEGLAFADADASDFIL